MYTIFYASKVTGWPFQTGATWRGFYCILMEEVLATSYIFTVTLAYHFSLRIWGLYFFYYRHIYCARIFVSIYIYSVVSRYTFDPLLDTAYFSVHHVSVRIIFHRTRIERDIWIYWFYCLKRSPRDFWCVKKRIHCISPNKCVRCRHAFIYNHEHRPYEFFVHWCPPH